MDKQNEMCFKSWVVKTARPFDPMLLRTADAESVPRLAASQLGRLRRIVDAATQLAGKGGFDGVRLRDVAQASQVSLGTLYKYFRSKEDILLFALTEEIEGFEKITAAQPPVGRTALDRLRLFFQRATTSMTRKPHFARAVLRSLACGTPEMAAQVAAFHLRITRLTVAALRGTTPDLAAPVKSSIGTKREQEAAFILQNVWFASLVGWAGGLHATQDVVDHVLMAAALMRLGSREG